jgi:hypothetical protein
MPFPGLFDGEAPDLASLGNFNSLLASGCLDPNLSAASGAGQNPWLNDASVADIAAAAAAAAALWTNQDGSSPFQFPFPMEKDVEIPNENLQESWSWCDSSRPKLRDLRALPSRGLGLHYTAGQFGVVTLPDARPPTGPAATVVRSTGVPEGRPSAAQGVQGPVPRGLPEVSWSVRDWMATRTTREPGAENWVVTEAVPLAKTVDASQEEWERRFCQREKQVMVGKGTRGYQEYIKMIPKEQRTARDPSTPRVAEQCSKRAFDGRLKQWRILLHAFSPRTSPENSPRTSTRESTDADIEKMSDDKTPGSTGSLNPPPLPKVWDGASAKARVAVEKANVPKHLAMELGNVFCGDHDGVQNLFGQPQFEYELAKRAHAYLSAENTQDFGTTLHAVSSVLEELRKTNAAATASCK